MSVATNVNFNQTSMAHTLSSSLCISVPRQTFCWLATFIAISYLFRSLADGNYLYSAVSVILVENNLLIYNLRTLTSIELFLNCEFYSRNPALIDVYNSGKILLGKKCFTSFDSLSELARCFLLEYERIIEIWLPLLKMRPH